VGTTVISFTLGKMFFRYATELLCSDLVGTNYGPSIACLLSRLLGDLREMVSAYAFSLQLRLGGVTLSRR